MRKSSTVIIGKVLQDIRKSFGYTQEKMAEMIEVSTRYIGDIEQDRAKPSYEVLIDICNLYNTSMDQIFSNYLKCEKNKSLKYGLAGFDNLKEVDRLAIEHLISYFNKVDKS